MNKAMLNRRVTELRNQIDNDGFQTVGRRRNPQQVRRQQEVTVVETENRQGKQTMTHYGKEEMPLKWEIPYRLLQHHAQQASLGLWVGVKLD